MKRAVATMAVVALIASGCSTSGARTSSDQDYTAQLETLQTSVQELNRQLQDMCLLMYDANRETVAVNALSRSEIDYCGASQP